MQCHATSAAPSCPAGPRPSGCWHPDCPCDAEEMAGYMVMIWALWSGRVPLAPPFEQFTAEELITFWADDLTASDDNPL